MLLLLTRYLILGQACCHLGLMEDAMVLLQTGRRVAAAAFRRESTSRSDDSFAFSSTVDPNASLSNPKSSPPTLPPTEPESASRLLSHIKLLLRRRTAALAALDAGFHSESVRHFSKILDGRRGTPHSFAAACLVGRAAAYKAAGRIAESIADCNRALALDPTSIPALRARADLMESVRALPDCLRDLDHLKHLYDSILRDRKLPGPAWKPHYDVRYLDIPSSLRALTARIQELRQRVASGEGCSVDHYKLIGVGRGCTRSELERAHRLLVLRHRPDKAAGFVDRLEFADEHRDLDAVRDQARMSALILYRMLQKGHSSIMSAVMDEEAAGRHRVAASAAALQLVASSSNLSCASPVAGSSAVVPPVYQGVFCRDMAVVGSVLSQVGFSRPIPVKYEALSC